MADEMQNCAEEALDAPGVRGGGDPACLEAVNAHPDLFALGIIHCLDDGVVFEMLHELRGEDNSESGRQERSSTAGRSGGLGREREGDEKRGEGPGGRAASGAREDQGQSARVKGGRKGGAGGRSPTFSIVSEGRERPMSSSRFLWTRVTATKPSRDPTAMDPVAS